MPDLPPPLPASSHRADEPAAGLPRADADAAACHDDIEASVDAPADADLAEVVLGYLQARRSHPPQVLGAPGPDAATLARCAELALRAPDHHALRPFRFVRVRPDQRPALAGLFAGEAQARGLDAADVTRAAERAHNGPELLAVVATLNTEDPAVPPHEQWICVGAGVMNLLNGLHLQGFAAKVLGGQALRSPLLAEAFCAPGECLAAWIVIGTPTGRPPARPVPPHPGVLVDWAGPQAPAPGHPPVQSRPTPGRTPSGAATIPAGQPGPSTE